MKAISCIAVCLLVVLLHQIQASTIKKGLGLQASLDLQTCQSPICQKPSIFHSESCLCHISKDAICPKDYTPTVQPHGVCECEKEISPVCPTGFEFNTRTCTCLIYAKPTCPAGSQITPHTSLCTGYTTATCPKGAVLKRCACYDARGRECPSGKLSPDRCTCKGQVAKPICSKGCTLNIYKDGCKCEPSKKVLCFSKSRYCTDTSYAAASIEECCININEPRSYEDESRSCNFCPYKPSLEATLDDFMNANT